MLSHAAPEPITGVKYKLEKFSESEFPMAQLLDSFRGKKIIEELLENPEEASINNIKAAKMKLICAFGSIVCSIVCTYVTTNVPIGCYDAAQTMCYTMLEEPKFSFFPVLSIIWYAKIMFFSRSQITTPSNKLKTIYILTLFVFVFYISNFIFY